MTTVSLVLDEEAEARGQRLADEHRLDQTEMTSAAFPDRLEDLDDFCIVERRMAKPSEPVPSAEVRKPLGLDH